MGGGGGGRGAGGGGGAGGVLVARAECVAQSRFPAAGTGPYIYILSMKDRVDICLPVTQRVRKRRIRAFFLLPQMPPRRPHPPIRDKAEPNMQ
jgi:hypothetical protein